MLLTAKTQRWTPEELLRALVEITARTPATPGCAANKPASRRSRPSSSSAWGQQHPPTWAYLTSLEWVAVKENITFIVPAGTGEIALGHAAVTTGLRVRYFTAELVENPLPRSRGQQRRQGHRDGAA